MNFKEYLKESVKTFTIIKPNGNRMIYTNQTDSKYLSTLQKQFPNMKITNKSSDIPAYVWSDPKSHGWQIETLAEDEGAATTTGAVAVVPTKLGKIQRRKKAGLITDEL